MKSNDVEGMTEYDYEDILMEALDRIKKGVQGSLEDITEQVKKEIEGKRKKEVSVPYTTFIENALSLPFHLRKVYFYLLESEESTLAEIAKDCKIDFQDVSGALRQLVQSGLIRSDKNLETGEVIYFIPKTRRIPKIKQDFTWKCFLGPAMPPIYQYNLLCDASRVEKLKNAITKTVKEGDIVADLGTGTGILAMFAAEKAKKVYAVEIDPFLIEAAKNIANYYPEADKIEFIEADAETVELDEKVDVVICEMLDTALIREPQIPVMNHAIQNLLKPGGKVVPVKAITKIELVNSDYDFYGYNFSMPYYEKCGARHVKDILSNQELLHTIRFDEINPTVVDREITIKIVKNGFVNSFRLTTYVYADEGTFMDPTIWLNPPLVLPLTHKGNTQDIYVKKSDDMSMYLFYEMGSSLDRISYSLI
jgi:predicted RNA methylase/predicted transcriptional regulator